MRVLFATNGSIAGHTSNEAKVNGQNVAVIAMGEPFGIMFGEETRQAELAEIIFCRELIDTQYPDLRGMVVAVEGSGNLDQAAVIFAYAKERSQSEPLGLHLVAVKEPDWLEKYGGVFHPITEGETSAVNAPRMMRYILERYLATGRLTGKF